MNTSHNCYVESSENKSWQSGTEEFLGIFGYRSLVAWPVGGLVNKSGYFWSSAWAQSFLSCRRFHATHHRSNLLCEDLSYSPTTTSIIGVSQHVFLASRWRRLSWQSVSETFGHKTFAADSLGQRFKAEALLDAFGITGAQFPGTSRYTGFLGEKFRGFGAEAVVLSFHCGPIFGIFCVSVRKHPHEPTEEAFFGYLDYISDIPNYT